MKPTFAREYLCSLFSQPKTFWLYREASIKNEPVPVQKSKTLSSYLISNS